MSRGVGADHRDFRVQVLIPKLSTGERAVVGKLLSNTATSVEGHYSISHFQPDMNLIFHGPCMIELLIHRDDSKPALRLEDDRLGDYSFGI